MKHRTMSKIFTLFMVAFFILVSSAGLYQAYEEGGSQTAKIAYIVAIVLLSLLFIWRAFKK